MSTTWSLPETDSRTMESLLSDLLHRTQALAAHLVDHSGKLIASAGDWHDYDLSAFASLVAADMAASDELAQMFGEHHVEGSVCLGSRRSLASARVGDSFVLCVIYDGRTSLGLVRHRMRTTVEKLVKEFGELALRARVEPFEDGSERMRFGVDAASALDDLLAEEESLAEEDEADL